MSKIKYIIVFSEFLPRVLGRRLIEFFRINLSSSFEDSYDADCKANVFNEFASAAFRWETFSFEKSLLPNQTIFSTFTGLDTL
jgi:hypothetical protein